MLLMSEVLYNICSQFSLYRFLIELNVTKEEALDIIRLVSHDQINQSQAAEAGSSNQNEDEAEVTLTSQNLLKPTPTPLSQNV